MSFWYVYGLTGSDLELPPGLPGVTGEAGTVQSIRDGALQAVVSPTDELGPDPTAGNTLAHQQVLGAIMQHGTIVPFAFGTVLPERLVRRFLTVARAECLDHLRQLEGKIEVGLKLVWRKERFLADVETPALRAMLGQPGYGETVSQQTQLGELLQQAADAKREEYRRTIFEPLAAAAAASRLHDPIGPRMVLNAAFLVDRSREAEFDSRVNEVCQPHVDRLDVSYTGPWPPYSFVSMRVHLGED